MRSSGIRITAPCSVNGLIRQLRGRLLRKRFEKAMRIGHETCRPRLSDRVNECRLVSGDNFHSADLKERAVHLSPECGHLSDKRRYGVTKVDANANVADVAILVPDVYVMKLIIAK